MDTPFAVILGLLAALLGLWALTEGSSSDSESAQAPLRTAPVRVIAERVEKLRGLEFSRVPEPVSVTPDQARKEGLADLDRTYPAARRRADEEILKLLGLVEPDLDLRELSGSVFSEGVAGYYDPRTKRLRTVRGSEAGSRVLAEMVLAHELTHALEDQRLSLELDELGGGSDDAALAYLSLVEGAASALMYQYVERHFTQEETLGGLAGAAFQDTGSIPPFLEAQLTFPYVGGAAFVNVLLERAGGRWDLVDTAYRLRPPASTEQVMHPRRYLRGDAPARVRLRLKPVLGRGWTRATAGTLGELQTRELLAGGGVSGAGDAAEGWGGDRYELWQSPEARGCAAPCARADVLVIRWAWDTPRDRSEFAAKLAGYVDHRDAAGGAVAIDRGRAITLALAPTPQLARRAARAAG
jgi:hypothetical protein